MLRRRGETTFSVRRGDQKELKSTRYAGTEVLGLTGQIKRTLCPDPRLMHMVLLQLMPRTEERA